MESCRPKSDDLEDPALAPLAEQLAADPHLAELFERMQHVDARLGEVFRDVPVPEGLADRITARLAAVRNGQKAADECRPPATPEATKPEAREPGAESAKPRRRRTRRWVLVGGAVAAVAASLVLAVVLPNGGPPVLDRDDLLEAAKVDFESHRNAQGKLLVESQPPPGYPLSRDIDVSRVAEIRWRPIRDLRGCQGVAYDLNLGRRRARRATLYVVRGTVRGLGNGPPAAPFSTTGGQSVGAWQAGELLCVLVVEGGARQYEAFLPQTPLA
jgi:hypothetical protein